MLAAVTCVLLGALALSPSALAAAGATTLGPGLAAPEDGEACPPGSDHFTPTVDCVFFQTIGMAGVLTQSPTDGTITTWRVDAFRGSARLVVLRPTGDGRYSITARSARETVPCQSDPPVLPTCGPITVPAQFATNLPIHKGDYIGIEVFNPPSCESLLGNNQACASVGVYTSGTGIQSAVFQEVDVTPADNTLFTPSRPVTGLELDFNADVVPGGIEGEITDGVTGKGLGQATVQITGTEVGGTEVDDTVTTLSDGTYADPLGAGTYTVRPEGVPPGEPPGLGYSIAACEGAAATTSCAVTLGANETRTASFAYPDCTSLKLTAADALADATFGARLDTGVKLQGHGFCPGMSVQFGNDQANAVVAGADISAGGTVATVKVPKYATTGDLKVDQLIDQPNGATALEDATLPDKFQVDSFRNTHGFSFANFARVSNLDEFDAAFGVDQTSVPETINTCPGVGKCPKKTYVLTSAAQNDFIDGVDQQHGVCFGMTLASQRFWAHDPAVSSLDSAARVPWDLGRAHAAQLIGEMQWLAGSRELQLARLAAIDDRQHRDGAVIRSEVATALDSGRVGAIVVIYDATRPIAHAVLAYRIEPDIADPRGYFIDVYDPNEPYSRAEDLPAGVFHASSVDGSRIRVSGDGSWSFPGLGVGGDSSDLVALQPGEFSNPHLGDRTLNVRIPPATTLTSLVDAHGKPLSLTDPTTSGIVRNPPPTGGPTPPSNSSFLAPIGRYTQTLTGSAALHETISAPGFVASITTAHPSGGEKLTIDPHAAQVGLLPAAASSFGTAPATIQLALNVANGEQRSATISGPGAAHGVRFGFDRRRTALSLLVVGRRTGHYKLTLSDTGRHHLPERFVSPSVTLAPGEEMTVAPTSWSRLATAHATGILTHSSGQRARVSLANESRLAGAVIAGLAAHKGFLGVRLRVPHLESGSTVDVFVTFHQRHHVVASSHTRATTLRSRMQTTIRLPRGRGIVATALAVTLSTGPAASSATSIRTLTLTR